MIWLVVAALIELHGPDGQVVFLNPDQVINIRTPRGLDKGHWGAGTRCIVLTTDGKFFTTSETCAQIREKLNDGGNR